ncbi:MAG: NUDIX hydrolase [Elusimicrobiota bacterium]
MRAPSAGKNGRAREFSAGGVVTRGGTVLLIRMRTLRGGHVWTFPKGHVEAAETPRRAALREVAEESGYECVVLAPLGLVRYSFVRSGVPVRKRVRWYWMRPRRRVGEPDPAEISGCKWLPYDEAKGLLRYPADFRLLEAVRRKREPGGGGAR